MSTSQTVEIRRLTHNQLSKLIRCHLTIPKSNKKLRLKYDANQILDLCDTAMELFMKEETLVRMDFVYKKENIDVNNNGEEKTIATEEEEAESIVVVGDIHGQFHDLMRVFTMFRGRQDGREGWWIGALRHKFMFLGDYVDRGFNSLECIVFLFALKCRFPDRYQLLRGNHESSSVNLEYGFQRELIDRYDSFVGKELWEKFNEVFKFLPLAGLIGRRILCMHGGISSHLNTLKDIENIKRPIDEPLFHPLAKDLLWADPSPAVKQYGCNTLRGADIEVFGIEAVEEACKRMGLQLILRAHQVVPNGFLFFGDCRRLATIFTAPRYEGNDNNGSVAVIKKDGKFRFEVLYGSKLSRQKFGNLTPTSDSPTPKTSESAKTESQKKNE